VHTAYDAKTAAQIVRQAMDSNDRLLVVDAVNAYWYNTMADQSFIQQQWSAA
jgi:hypothetical protein